MSPKLVAVLVAAGAASLALVTGSEPRRERSPGVSVVAAPVVRAAPIARPTARPSAVAPSSPEIESRVEPQEGTPGLAEPDEATLAALEILTARGDGPGLLRIFREDRTLARYAALRSAIELGVRAGLVDELALESDANALEILGDALGAGGTADEARRLGELLPRLEREPARVAAARALCDMAGRLEIPAATLSLACASLEAACQDEALAPAAARALGDSGEGGLLALERVAGSTLPERSRLAAAEVLLARSPARAAPALADLTRGNDVAVARLAALYAERR